MSEEELEEMLRRLNETRKQREKRHIEAKGVLKGIRLGGELTPTEEAFIKLLEILTDAFQNVTEDIISLREDQIRNLRMINRLAARIKELENNTLQLRQTLDRMVQDR